VSLPRGSDSSRTSIFVHVCMQLVDVCECVYVCSICSLELISLTTAKKTHGISVTKTSRLMVFRKIIAVNYEN
jgi:hypothetical protein